MVGPRPALPSGHVFSGCGLKIKFLLPMFCLPCCPVSDKVWHDPSCPKTPGGYRFGSNSFFAGSRPDPRGPLGQSHSSKNYLRGVQWALRISQRVNSYSTFALGQTHRRTDIWVRIFFIKAKLSGTFWKVIFILHTSMIRCIPWPPGAQEEQILQDLNTPVPLRNFYLVHFVKDLRLFRCQIDI